MEAQGTGHGRTRDWRGQATGDSEGSVQGDGSGEHDAGHGAHSDVSAALGVAARKWAGKVGYLDVRAMRIQGERSREQMEISKPLWSDSAADVLTMFVEGELADKRGGRDWHVLTGQPDKHCSKAGFAMGFDMTTLRTRPADCIATRAATAAAQQRRPQEGLARRSPHNEGLHLISAKWAKSHCADGGRDRLTLARASERSPCFPPFSRLKANSLRAQKAFLQLLMLFLLRLLLFPPVLP